MWKPYTVSIFDFMDQKFLLMIFRTSFSKNWPFLPLFSKILILTKAIKDIDKTSLKFVPLAYFEHILYVPLINLDKIRFFEKVAKIGQFLLNEVLKITNKKFLAMK